MDANDKLALQVYRDLVTRIAENPNDASWMPMGSGDIVGRSRWEAEARKRGVEIPSNFINQMEWWDRIGGTRLAKRLSKQFKSLQLTP